MGLVKREWEENLERGWTAPDKNVCAGCVEDIFLKAIINANLAARRCDYCGKGGRGYVAAPVAAIMEPIAATFFAYFADPTHAGVPYDGGGFAFEPNLTTEDALNSLGLECHEDLFADIAGGLDQDILWVEAANGSWAGSHLSEYMGDLWRQFEQKVKHEVRFFFGHHSCANVNSGEQSPLKTLKALGQIISDLNLIQHLPVETMLYRARERKQKDIWQPDADTLGAPPNENTLSQRMNPAGISYFYLARERQTALAEIMERPPCRAVIASFQLCREFKLLDLIEFPEFPSVFEQQKYATRELLLFLRDFVDNIIAPVQKDGREHIAYVPSQIVCEYFAKVFLTKEGNRLDGLAYPSAVRPGGINIVLFPPQQGREGFKNLVEFVGAEEIVLSHWTEFSEAIR